MAFNAFSNRTLVDEIHIQYNQTLLKPWCQLRILSSKGSSSRVVVYIFSISVGGAVC